MISRIAARLSALGVQMTTIAPAINSVDDLKLKSPSEVAKRLVILSYLIGVYDDVDAKDLVEQLKK